MSPVLTSISSTSIVFQWVAPNDNGSPLISYKVEFLNKNENLYNQIQTLCDPILATTCTIQMSNFTQQLGYQPGSLIIARVSALNSIGWSTPSTTNTFGVLAQSTPQAAPTNFTLSSTSASTVQL